MQFQGWNVHVLGAGVYGRATQALKLYLRVCVCVREFVYI